MELNYKFSSALKSINHYNALGGICNSASQLDFLDSLYQQTKQLFKRNFLIKTKNMKKINVLVLSITSLFMLFTSCMKDNNGVNFTVLDNEKNQIKSALDLSQAYNDTLIIVYDTALMHRNNKYCIKYDKLYHKNDSMFNMHYTQFGNEMYKDGMMMSNYNPSGGMMQGGMMNYGSNDKNRMMGDTAMVGGYYRNMNQLHSKHATYHNGIYN
jgi:hypothetical protein